MGKGSTSAVWGTRKNARFRWLSILMVIAILGITGFQVYWLKDNYNREKQNLDIKANSAFRQTIFRLQSSKLKLENFSPQFDSLNVPDVFVESRRRTGRPFNRRFERNEQPITILNLLQEKMRDSFETANAGRRGPVITITSSGIKGRMDTSGGRRINVSQSLDTMVFVGERRPDGIIIEENRTDRPEFRGNAGITIENHVSSHGEASASFGPMPIPPRDKGFFRFLYSIDSLSAKDSVTTKEITNAYTARLKEENIGVQFKVGRLPKANIPNLPNEVTIGFSQPTTFSLTLQNTFTYILGKLKLPVLFSFLLIGITIASFVLLYRNMIRQQRLAALKNDFISNITHELKTPIATVGVALEALKSFNAIDDPARTREYLDISQNELQRLNLLVDKVLKLSVFEKKEIELKEEVFDYKQLVQEVMNSMRLQFEKFQTKTSLHAEGNDFLVNADKLHITSVIYNLLDNAIKYNKENPVIDVILRADEATVELQVTDNGIGIPSEYKGKIFEKFFRVPTGNRHNTKGYGLGLSYVSEVMKRHQGSITVESEPGQGSAFTVRLPRNLV